MTVKQRRQLARIVMVRRVRMIAEPRIAFNNYYASLKSSEFKKDMATLPLDLFSEEDIRRALTKDQEAHQAQPHAAS